MSSLDYIPSMVYDLGCSTVGYAFDPSRISPVNCLIIKSKSEKSKWEISIVPKFCYVQLQIFIMIILLFFSFFSIQFYQLEANYFTILQWFLPYTDMNQPWIYMYSPSRSPLPPPSPPDPFGSSQCTSPMYRTDLWTLWEKVRVGCLERTASKHVYYQG